MQDLLGRDVRILERGALDALTENEIEALAPKTSEQALVTRLRDGTEVKVGEDAVMPCLQECVRQMQAEAELILLLCTGNFPPLQSQRTILYPAQVLYNVVRGLGTPRIGVLTPAEEQRVSQWENWRTITTAPVVEVASPYGPQAALDAAADRLARADIDLVIMDCIGYTRAMKAFVRQRVGKPVVLARSALARVAAELL
jgi:protein AroM